MRKILNDSLPWATIFVGVILVIVAGIGGVITIVHPATLPFASYTDALQKIVVGIGILGVGRGVVSAGKNVGGPTPGAGAGASAGDGGPDNQ